MPSGQETDPITTPHFQFLLGIQITVILVHSFVSMKWKIMVQIFHSLAKARVLRPAFS